MDIGGFLFHISDTAGLRETDDEIEREGIKRSLLAFEEADMCLFMVDASSPDLSDEFIERMQSTGKPYILVYNKMDLMPLGASFVERVGAAAPEAVLYIRCNEGDVVRRQVIEQLETFAQEKYTISPESLLISNRDLQLLQEMSGYLGAALIQREMPMEVRCQYLRMALSCLGNIVGKIDVEEILDSVFGSFCIGK
jgi:tRNA modification GTPase